jgi:hypothetical protein
MSVGAPAVTDDPDLGSIVAASDVMLIEVRMDPGDASVQSAWDESHSSGAATLLVGTPARLIGAVHTQHRVAAVESGRLPDPITALLDDGHVTCIQITTLTSSSSVWLRTTECCRS